MPATHQPEIIHVNGVQLTDGQAMTVRVALESYAMFLKVEGLGDDHHGRLMTKLYLDRINEIRKLYTP